MTKNASKDERTSPQTGHQMASRALLILALATAHYAGAADSDTFDSSPPLDAQWKPSNFNAALVSTSFPNTGTGKGFRVQANPFPNTAPAAAMYYRDTIYTNFYMAVDLANWPGTDKNQAVVLVARGTLSANPATTTAIIMNYDTSQYGENPDNRRQGQFQINMVTNNPAFGTKTLAATEITLQPGRSYRLIFKAEGSLYTGLIYDYEDFTRPLIKINADDVIQGNTGGGLLFSDGFKYGKSGLLAFSRQSTVGTVDQTFDNYFATEGDPNPPGLALPHPVTGTPVVDTRVPAERWKNFHNPAAGISFTAKTFTTDVINAAATKLYLNGIDVSGQLVLSVNGTSITGSLPGSALAANSVYSAAIVVEDVSGTRKSTNTFWFDTFTDAYLKTASVKTIEAEEYNYEGAKFQLDPIPVSGTTTNGQTINGGGTGYFAAMGWGGMATGDIDYKDNRTAPENPWGPEFRQSDSVGLSQGMYPEIQDLNESTTAFLRRSDNIRSQYASQGLLEFVVHRTEAGEWLNYSRIFPTNTYAVYLRVASFGATAVDLYEVTSDPSLVDQTTNRLGTFNVPNLITRYNYRYIPLTDTNGAPTTVTLGGTNTIRLQMAGTVAQDNNKLAINYMLFVPQTMQVFSSANITGPYIADASAIIDSNQKKITIPMTGSSKFVRLVSNVRLTITSTSKSGGNLVLTYQ